VAQQYYGRPGTAGLSGRAAVTAGAWKFAQGGIFMNFHWIVREAVPETDQC
jgi:hypothetical protein